jgi:hypothetical protein
VLDGCRLLIWRFVRLETNARSCDFGGGSFSFIALVEAGFLVGAMMKDENVNETNEQSKKKKKNMPII